MNSHVFSFLEAAAEKWESRTAIIEQDKKISFVELLDTANRMAEKIEIAIAMRGRGIGFVCRNSSHFVAGLFACSKAGGIVMPILSGTKSVEIENLLSESSIQFLLAEKESNFSFSLKTEKISIDSYFDLFVFQEIEATNIDSVFKGAAFIRPSSGTTGSSKGVVISHTSVYERTEAANEGLRLDENSTMLWVLPMAFHFVVSILLYIRYGVTMIISDHFTAAAMIDLANKFMATHLYASPLHFRLLASEKKDLKFATLKKAISTSAQLEPAVSKNFFEKFGIPASQAYGIIEIGLPFINHETGNEKSESIGKPLPKYKAAILDDQLNEIAPGLQGSFAIKGPGMFSGYLWPLKKKEDVLADSWFLTGDIAEMDMEGFVFIKGRNKSMINVSGNKVFPEEVEAILKMHDDVDDARVYGGSHPVTGELVEAEVVLKTGKEANAEEMILFCRERLAAYKVPQRIFFVDVIRKTKTGKISRV
jgi:long-chain acyl-CoA synthetase